MQCVLLLAAILLPFLVVSQPSKGCNTSLVTGFETVIGPVDIDTSPLEPFEIPKLSAINETAWEYWYFDAVSSDGTSGMSIIFFKDPSTSSLGLGNLRIQLDAVWANNSHFNSMLFVNQSTIIKCEDGIEGIWNTTSEGINFSFEISNDLHQAYVTIAGPNIAGTYSLTSKAPARYPDGELYPSTGASVALGPLIYWNEAIPAGFVNVSISLEGELLSFTGAGGHDRNYAPFIWDYIAQHWYWLRVTTGPYAMVYWLWTSAIDGNTYTSAFLTEHGREVFSTTNDARSLGSGKSYAAMSLLYDDVGVHGDFADMSTGICVDLVDEESDKSWRFELKHRNIVYGAPAGVNNNYTRFVNTASGEEVGHEVWDGVAMSEQNVIVAPITLP